jgi:hypothetical protein
MGECPSCGAARSPDLEWCGQCYVRYDAPTEQSTAKTVLMVVRSRGGSDGEPGLTFPLWMRGIITLCVLGGGLVLIEGFRPWWELGRPAWVLSTILLTIYASLGAVLAARMWAPDTFTEPDRIVLLDRRAMDDVEARQQGLVLRDDAATAPQTR